VDVPRHTGAWVGASVLAVLTVVVLIPVPAAVRALAAASGAFTGGLPLTVIGLALILSHAKLTFGV
jgi:hypothetical protein